MGLAERQGFLAKLLTDEETRKDFLNSTSNKFGLSEDDYSLLKQINPTGIKRKANVLMKKSGKNRKPSEGA
jgi:hypothetical protein